jgi:hypothetical protein
MRNLLSIFCITLIFLTKSASCQSELFQEIGVEKELGEFKELEFSGKLVWKNLYGDPGWRRWGISFVGAKEIKKFKFLGGINGFYTFNSKITNFFELRPWMAADYDISLPADIVLKQRIRPEWRLFFNEEKVGREDHVRLRYRLNLDFPIDKKDEKFWKLRTSFEWYFTNPASYERFSNETDYGIFLIRGLKNDHVLSFGYLLEVFYDVESEHVNGHIFSFDYTF